MVRQGGYQDHHGRFYTVENARLYTLPRQTPSIMVAAGGRRSAELAVGGPLLTELPIPAHFQAAARRLDEDDIAESVVCGPDPERHVKAIREFESAGFDHVCVHQLGPDQKGFLRFYAREVLPRLGSQRAAA